MVVTNIATFATLFVVICNCENTHKIVNTKNGPVRGIDTIFNEVSVTTFYGIPYAEPPVGKLRFKKPESLEVQWVEPLDATKPKVACMQNLKDLNVNMSEDCLYLNIWLPNSKVNTPKAVMFWIYGGYFTTGHIDREEYNALPVAAIGDVIVVAVNYRVDVFGFLYGGNSETPGNVGFHDQVLALRWVHENIASFGGDPNQVTIVGESAGSVSVGGHIISQLSRKYFKRAIMQSGSPHKFEGLHKKGITPENSLRKAKQMAHDFGCDVPHWIECLQKVNGSEIMDWIKTNGSFFPLYTKSIDGFFPSDKSPIEALSAGIFKEDIQLLIGTVANEGSSYMKNVLPDYFNRENQKLIDKSQAKQFTKDLINYPNMNSDAVAEFYVDHIYHENRNELRAAVASAYGDFRVTCPIYYYGKKVAQYSNVSRVHSFQFQHKPKVGIPKNCVDWMGVCHADDIIFTFGLPLRFPDKYSIEDYYFSLLIINIWTSFVKTGDPLPKYYFNMPNFSQPDLKWPAFRVTSSIGDHIIPNYMILHPKYFGNKVYYPFQSNCEGIWKPYFDIQ